MVAVPARVSGRAGILANIHRRADTGPRETHSGGAPHCAAMERTDLLASSCAAALVADGTAPGWVQLMPIGQLKPGDGREPWTNDDPQSVIAASKCPMAIDYDHGTDLGGPSKAAGWIEELAPKGPNGEPGLWGRVKWTPDGDKAVASKEYRFLSPVFLHTKTDRRVMSIQRASLTNNPALALKALASVQQLETASTMDLSKLISLLGLSAGASLADIMAAVKALADKEKASASALLHLTAIATAAGLKFDTAISDDAVTAICTKLKTPMASAQATADQVRIDTLEKSVATLTAQLSGQTAATTVAAAIAAGKVTPGQKAWALDYCARDPKGFGEFVTAAPTIMNGNRIAPGAPADGVAPLDDEQKAIATALGLDHAKFAISLAAQRKNERV